MRFNEKLKIMRDCKGWTQDQIAEKLGWAVNSYGKIERGETVIKIDKLQKVAEIMGVDVKELLDVNEGSILNFAEHCNLGNQQGLILLSEAQYVHELEKYKLILEHRDKEISWLKEKIEGMAEIIALLKERKTEGKIYEH